MKDFGSQYFKAMFLCFEKIKKIRGISASFSPVTRKVNAFDEVLTNFLQIFLSCDEKSLIHIT